MKVGEFISIVKNEWMPNEHYTPRRKHMKMLLSIIESQRAALETIESMATIETVEITKIARAELDKEI